MTNDIDWQGHRGCRGLLPENTIPAFLRALSYPAIKTLELDVVISADDRVIVSHEPWLSPEICLAPHQPSLPYGGRNCHLRLRSAAPPTFSRTGKSPGI